MAPRLRRDLCAAALHHTARLRPLRPDRPRSDFVATATPGSFVRWHYLWYVAAALAVMIVAITSRHLWLLNFVHVLCSLLWTGIDLEQNMRGGAGPCSVQGAASRYPK